MINYHKIVWWLYNWLPWLTIINSHLFLHWLCDLATHLNLRKWHQSWWFSQRVVNNQSDFFIAPPPCLGHSAGRAWMSSPFGRLDPIGPHTLPLSPKSQSEERGFDRDHQRHHQRRSSTIIYCLSPPLARGSIFPGAALNIPSWQPLKIWRRFGWQFLDLVAIVWS